MKHHFSALISVMLSIGFVFCTLFSFVPALALEPTLQNDTLVAYTHDILPQILEYHSIAEPHTIVIGNAIPTYYFDGEALRSAEYEAFPLFIDGTVYSIIRQYTAPNGVKSYSCRLDARTIVNINANAGVLVHTDEFTYLTDNLSNIMGNDALAVNAQNSIDLDTSLQLTEISSQNGTVLEFSDSVLKSNLRYSDEGEYPVDYVENAVTQCCPDGLCWAACCASLANTFAGGSYTALSFHDSVDCDLYHQHYQDEEAYHTYMIVFLNDAGVLTSRSQYTSNLTYSTLKKYVDNDQVALLHLDSRSSKVGHYVIGYGYYTTNSGSKHFRYMDPNEGECTSQFPSSGTVYVVASGIAYAIHCYVKCY